VPTIFVSCGKTKSRQGTVTASASTRPGSNEQQQNDGRYVDPRRYSLVTADTYTAAGSDQEAQRINTSLAP
jgi:hypothetical protein